MALVNLKRKGGVVNYILNINVLNDQEESWSRSTQLAHPLPVGTTVRVTIGAKVYSECVESISYDVKTDSMFMFVFLAEPVQDEDILEENESLITTYRWEKDEKGK